MLAIRKTTRLCEFLPPPLGEGRGGGTRRTPVSRRHAGQPLLCIYRRRCQAQTAAPTPALPQGGRGQDRSAPSGWREQDRSSLSQRAGKAMLAFGIATRVCEFLPPPLGEGRGGGTRRTPVSRRHAGQALLCIYRRRCQAQTAAPTPALPQGGRGQDRSAPSGWREQDRSSLSQRVGKAMLAFGIATRVCEFLPPPLGEGRGGGTRRTPVSRRHAGQAVRFDCKRPRQVQAAAPTPALPQGGREQDRSAPSGWREQDRSSLSQRAGKAMLAFGIATRVCEFLPPPLGEGRGGGTRRTPVSRRHAGQVVRFDCKRPRQAQAAAPTPALPQGGREQDRSSLSSRAGKTGARPQSHTSHTHITH
jgi:hypothetical protein